jgi:hypothetical protein
MKNAFLFRIYIVLTGGAISSVGILHLLRLIFQVPVTVGTLSVPMVFSYFGLIASLGVTILAIYLFLGGPHCLSVKSPPPADNSPPGKNRR